MIVTICNLDQNGNHLKRMLGNITVLLSDLLIACRNLLLEARGVHARREEELRAAAHEVNTPNRPEHGGAQPLKKAQGLQNQRCRDVRGTANGFASRSKVGS